MPSATRPQVVIVQQLLRRYRTAFFEALRANLDSAGIDLRLVHSDVLTGLRWRPHDARIPWAEVRPARRIGGWRSSLLWQPIIGSTRDADLVIVEQATRLLANYILFARQQFGGPRVALWGHGRNYLVPEHTNTAPELVKRVLSRRAHWWFAYNDRTAEVVAGLGYPEERIAVVDNATDTRWLASQVDATTPAEVAAARESLGIKGENVCLFVGTLGAVKRFDRLFASADMIRSRVPDFELVVIGNGMEEPVVAAWTAERPWAHHAGPRFGKDVVPLLAMAKLLLVPGWAGLVVVDSFAACVPLVASASLPHPPEIAYLRDNVNGRLVDDGGDPAKYADAVVELLRDRTRREELVRGCAETRGHYSTDAMAARFATGVVAALQRPTAGAD